jgi:3-deoxy-manno-octulosonate cytidylyltransferase (CMP-KDO synthetase)
LAEVASKVVADRYILVQGDEPLLEPTTIDALCALSSYPENRQSITTLKTLIKEPVDVVNNTIIKIVTNLDNEVLFASRSPLPYPKGSIFINYYKSVGVYCYPRDIIKNYPNLKKGPLEQAEGHDFMRPLENHISIKAYEYDTQTISVDTAKDLERVRSLMETCGGLS